MDEGRMLTGWIATDPVKQCFNCHVPQKAQDFTFSKYLE
jgi:hypothetical protein